MDNNGDGQSRKHELQQIAEIYFNFVSEEIKLGAESFLNSIDPDGDGQVSLPEYIAYMTGNGYSRMATPQFFNYLNTSGTGKLNFTEVLTLYYIIQSRRPFCNGCGAFMEAIFFTCVNCFDEHPVTFDVCPTCFQGGNYVHNNSHVFCDNHALLETKRLMALEEKRNSNQAEVFNLAPGPSSTSTGIVVYNQNQRTRWLEAAVRLGSFASGAASIIANCSIM